MAKIKNSGFKNVYGDGYEKIVTMDNGDEYVLKNTGFKNVYGDGYEQELVKKGTSEGCASLLEAVLLLAIGVFLFLMIYFGSAICEVIGLFLYIILAFAVGPVVVSLLVLALFGDILL